MPKDKSWINPPRRAKTNVGVNKIAVAKNLITLELH